MPGNTNATQKNMDPLKKLQMLNAKKTESLYFFCWLFDYSYDEEPKYDAAHFTCPLPLKKISLREAIEGPSNSLGSLSKVSAREIEFQKGRDNINNLSNSKKNMWFASNEASPVMQDIQSSLKELSRLLDNPQKDSAEYTQYREDLSAALAKVKAHCEKYIETHSSIRWTPTGRARKSLVRNALKTVTEFEELAQINLSVSTDDSTAPQESAAEPVNPQQAEQIKERIQKIADHPYCVKENNKSFEYKKGSHNVSDITKFIKPVDYRLTKIKEISPELFARAQREIEIPDPVSKQKVPEHEIHARKALKLIYDFSGENYNKDILEEKSGKIPSKDNKPIVEFTVKDSKYDLDASQLYKEIGEYIKLRKSELNDPNSLASQLKQLKDSVFPEGTLQIPTTDDAIFIDATGKAGVEDDLNFDGDKDLLFSAQILEMLDEKPMRAKRTAFLLDFTDEPLFPKEPHPSDIFQGRVGNCFFLSYMSKLAQEDPQGLKDMFRDNGDGTVTCRFYNEQRQPVFVTVNKTVPYDRFETARGTMIAASNEENVPLWVHMAEKAYMMSGLKMFRAKEMSNLEKDYQKNHTEYKPGPYHPTELERRIYEKRFGKADFDPERLFKTMGRGYFGLDGGFASEVSRHVTGRNSYTNYMNTLSLTEVVGALDENIEQTDLKKEDIFGAETINDIKSNYPYILEIIIKEASNGIAREVDKEDADGRDASKDILTPSSVMTIEQIEDHLLDYKKTKVYEDYLKRHEYYLKANPGADVFKQVSNRLIASMRERQRNNNGRFPIIPSSKSGPGNYTKYENDLFDFLTEKLDKGLHLGASMNLHAYSIVGYKAEGDTKKLVLRNPWGSVGLKNKGINYTSLEKRVEYLYSDRKIELGGLFEIDISEFVTKGQSFSFDEESKVMSMDDMKTTITKQLIDAYISEHSPEKQEMLKRGMNLPESLKNVKNSDFVQQLAEEYMANETVKFHAEKMGRIPERIFYRDIRKHTGREYLTKAPAVTQSSKEKSTAEVILETSAKNIHNKWVREGDVSIAEQEASTDIKQMNLS